MDRAYNMQRTPVSVFKVKICIMVRVRLLSTSFSHFVCVGKMSNTVVQLWNISAESNHSIHHTLTLIFYLCVFHNLPVAYHILHLNYVSHCDLESGL